MSFLKNPRVYIYLLVVLAVVILMKMDKRQQTRQPEPSPQPRRVIRMVPATQLRPSTQQTRVILLLPPGEQLSADLQKKLEGRHITETLQATDELKQFYGVEQLPVILTLDAQGNVTSKQPL